MCAISECLNRAADVSIINKNIIAKNEGNRVSANKFCR
jgi:hypothetical protein